MKDSKELRNKWNLNRLIVQAFPYMTSILIAFVLTTIFHLPEFVTLSILIGAWIGIMATDIKNIALPY